MKAPPDDLAQRLVATSGEILARSGDVRFDDVAKSVGVARATLYYYFSGRDDLVAFVLAEHLRAGAAVIEAARTTDASPATQLRAAVAGLVRFLGEHPGLCAGVLAAMGSAGKMDDALAANERHIAAPVRAMVQAAISAGAAAPGDPDDRTSAILGGVLMTVLARAYRGADTTSEAAGRDVAEVVLGPVLR